jgi:hypothetical protein
MKTVATVVSKYKVFSTQSTKDSLERLADEDLDSSVQFSGNESLEESATETLIATATVKNQKTSHWCMCYNFDQ